MWRLVHRWEEEPPGTEREVSVVLETMQSLLEEGTFDQRDFSAGSEWFEKVMIAEGIERLNQIADGVGAVDEAEKRRAAFKVIQEKVGA